MHLSMSTGKYDKFIRVRDPGPYGGEKGLTLIGVLQLWYQSYINLYHDGKR